jgi:tetratricopeptide (TPR) repeat protein
VRHDFSAWDDYGAVQTNPSYNPPKAATLAAFWSGFTQGFYDPVLFSIWWFVAVVSYTAPTPGGAAGGLSAGLFHACNLAAHAANALIVFQVLRILVGRRTGPALLGAALFAVHPIQVEAVAWLSTFYTSLSTTFGLLALWCYLRFSEAHFGLPLVPVENDASTRRPWRLYALSAAFFVLSLLTKPSFIALPLIAGALEMGLRGRRWRQLIPLVPLALLTLPIVVLTKLAQPATKLAAPLWLRPLVALDAVSFYLRKLVIPVQYVPDYGRSPSWLAASGWPLATCWVIPVCLLIIAFLLRRRAKWVGVALVVMVAALLPTSGLSPFDFQRYSTTADRYFYVGMFAVCLSLAFVLDAFWNRRVAVAATAAMILLASFTIRQVNLWADDGALFRRNLALNPRSKVARGILAFLERKNGNLNESILLFQSGVAIDPDHYEFRIGLARALAATGRLDAALNEFREALRISPDNPNVLFEIGNLCLKMDRTADAVAAYTKLLDGGNEKAEVDSNLGVALAKSGHFDRALPLLTRSLELDPENPTAHLNIALVYLERDDLLKAKHHYQEVIRLKGDVAAAKSAIAVIDEELNKNKK